MKIQIPKKLRATGNHIRVIAPARSLSIVSEEARERALQRFAERGCTVSFGKHVLEIDRFNSSSIESRIEDLHDAFRDESVDAIFTSIGGYNCNQLLDYIDFDLIRRNPKILCGFSDITILSNALLARTGLVTYSGPHFSSWGMKLGFEYSAEYFEKCLRSDQSMAVTPSVEWSDDPWYMDQDKREFHQNEGWWILNEGGAEGRLVGGHLRCVNALQGTKYWPGLEDSILFVEEDFELGAGQIDRQIQALIHQPNFDKVRGFVVGRFQPESKMSRDLVEAILSKRELRRIPVIANVDFGHTTPTLTLPVGGTAVLEVFDGRARFEIQQH